MTGPRKAYRKDTFRLQTFASALEGLAVSELDSADEAANKLAARLEEACDQSMQHLPFGSTTRQCTGGARKSLARAGPAFEPGG